MRPERVLNSLRIFIFVLILMIVTTFLLFGTVKWILGIVVIILGVSTYLGLLKLAKRDLFRKCLKFDEIGIYFFENYNGVIQDSIIRVEDILSVEMIAIDPGRHICDVREIIIKYSENESTKTLRIDEEFNKDSKDIYFYIIDNYDVNVIEYMNDL